MGIFSNITKGLRNILFDSKIDDEYFEDLEEQLIMADVGVVTAKQLTDNLRKEAKSQKINDGNALKPILSKIIEEMVAISPERIPTDKPRIILVIGVNGVGKTTSIGKLAKRFTDEGKTVLLAAADTFRAAATEQLTIWSERTGAKIISHAQGADPAAVVHDAVNAGVARGTDVIICDTAGRLHNKKNLMDELSKIRRVVEKELPSCVPQVLLVVDATMGQNAVVQAKMFKEAAGVDGVILTKLDGTAKGGIVIAIANELALPVCYVGVGEKAEDLYAFNPHDFSVSLFGEE
ncbi:MAG: signal recognition particle-docking protein FtsY [Oscillospiraceae bacterium]